MKPDRDMARRFLGALDSGDVFTFQTIGEREKNFSLNRVLHGPFNQHVEELVRLNASGAGVFVMINKGDGVVHPGKKTCRTKKNVVAVRSLFVDLDGSPLKPLVEALPPDITVESSLGRWHAYWLVEDCPLDHFEFRQSELAEKFHGDSTVCDLPRVMRMPGFMHQKAEPFMTRLVRPE